MKKPFKLNAYYLVNMYQVDSCDAINELGLEYNGNAVIHINPDIYSLRTNDDFGYSVHADSLDCWVLLGTERKYCKRCDNAFVAGVTYIDSDEVEYLCKLDDDGVLILLDESDGEMYFCNDYSPKDFTPKVGMIN